jgi:hypothetical protein
MVVKIGYNAANLVALGLLGSTTHLVVWRPEYHLHNEGMSGD